MLYKHFTETNDSLTLSLVFNTSFIFIFRFTPTIDIEPKKFDTKTIPTCL